MSAAEGLKQGVSPVGGVVAVELGQRHLLQLDLQLLVLALQVHDHAVQEVDLDTEGTEVRSSQARSVWTAPPPHPSLTPSQ